MSPKTPARPEQPGLLPLAEALARMLAAVTPVAATETLPLAALSGRILVADVVSTRAVPPADNSAMDGYACRHADLALAAHLGLVLVGKALAGHPFGGVLEAGQCVRITTGGELPVGADTVVMQEHSQVIGDRVYIERAPAPGTNIRRSGEDIASGATLLTAGHRLGPVDIGLLASVGIAQVAVRRRLRVALLATGSELRAPGEPLGRGDIYESNRFVLAAMLARFGAELIDLGVVADDPALLRAAFGEASGRADAVIASGGASVGEADYTHALLTELGAVDFWRVAIKPGKPFMFGHLFNYPFDRGAPSLFFGLPGNPVAALVTFHQLVVPVLRRLQGERHSPPLLLQATLTDSVRRNRLRLDLQRGLLAAAPSGSAGLGNSGLGNPGLIVTPDFQQSSGALSSVSRSNCFVLIEAGEGSVAASDPVTVLPFDELLR